MKSLTLSLILGAALASQSALAQVHQAHLGNAELDSDFTGELISGGTLLLGHGPGTLFLVNVGVNAIAGKSVCNDTAKWVEGLFKANAEFKIDAHDCHEADRPSKMSFNSVGKFALGHQKWSFENNAIVTTKHWGYAKTQNLISATYSFVPSDGSIKRHGESDALKRSHHACLGAKKMLESISVENQAADLYPNGIYKNAPFHRDGTLTLTIRASCEDYYEDSKGKNAVRLTVTPSFLSKAAY